MANLKHITEHMEVVASDGTHVGTVDHLEDENMIKLTRQDSDDGHHHFIPVDWVKDVGDTVRLGKTSNEVFSQWKHG